LADFTEEYLKAAHKASFRNEDDVAKSETVGCFFCLAISPSGDVDWWEERDGRKTAVCRKCGIDSVIAPASGYPITPEFLQAMRKRSFGK